MLIFSHTPHTRDSHAVRQDTAPPWVLSILYPLTASYETALQDTDRLTTPSIPRPCCVHLKATFLLSKYDLTELLSSRSSQHLFH